MAAAGCGGVRLDMGLRRVAQPSQAGVLGRQADVRPSDTRPLGLAPCGEDGADTDGLRPAGGGFGQPTDGHQDRERQTGRQRRGHLPRRVEQHDGRGHTAQPPGAQQTRGDQHNEHPGGRPHQSGGLCRRQLHTDAADQRLRCRQTLPRPGELRHDSFARHRHRRRHREGNADLRLRRCRPGMGEEQRTRDNSN